jgi:hypothetical protein
MNTSEFFSKHFSVDEADAWIPRLRPLFDRIHSALAAVREDVEVLHHNLVHLGNGGGIDVAHYFAEDGVLEAALTEIQDAGILIKDVSRGLVDFPAILDGREVLLCWELSEGDRVEFYHDIQAGYGGRRSLER